ncbi:MAG TPA: PEPxxWA-CTERM sorting domain-containing protein [Phenylobacterium sp.]|jgi:hypothetical protein
MIVTIRRIAFAAGAAALALISSAARASGDVQIDSPIGGQTSPFTLCQLGQSCTGFDMGFNVALNNGGSFNKIYVYRDGVIGLGQALPVGATLGNLASLGDYYAAVGFEDLSPTSPDLAGVLTDPNDVGVTVSRNGGTDHGLPAGTVDEILVDYFIGDWHTQAGYHGMMQVRFATHQYGSISPSLPTISLLHGTPAGGQMMGVTWTDPSVFPDGLVGLSLGPDAESPGLPEPATWALMISGFGLAGVALRRRGRPIPA